MLTDRLSVLQRDLVRALAQRDSGFFLTGGGVLVGFILGHRTTDDLDLFTTERLPGDLPRDTIIAFVRDLEARMRKRAFPHTP